MATDKETTETAPAADNTQAETITVEIADVQVVQTDMFEKFVKSDLREGVVTFKENTPFEVWESYTRGMLEIGRRSMRVVGCCLLFGERKYGEKYAQVIDAMRYNPKTLQNAVLVVKNIKTWHDSLSFAHHDVVCTLKDKDQNELLTLAETEHLTVAKLRKVRNEKFPGKKKKKNKTTGNTHKLNLSDEGEMQQAAHTVIAFLEQAEAAEPFRKWSKTRREQWGGIFKTIRKMQRRGGWQA